MWAAFQTLVHDGSETGWDHSYEVGWGHRLLQNSVKSEKTWNQALAALHISYCECDQKGRSVQAVQCCRQFVALGSLRSDCIADPGSEPKMDFLWPCAVKTVALIQQEISEQNCAWYARLALKRVKQSVRALITNSKCKKLTIVFWWSRSGSGHESINCGIGAADTFLNDRPTCEPGCVAETAGAALQAQIVSIEFFQVFNLRVMHSLPFPPEAW